MAEAVARDRVRDPVECTDRDIDLVMHRDKDMDMFHLDRDFNVSVWAYGQPGTAEPETYSCYCHVRCCVLYLEVSEEPSSSRRSPACRGGAQPYRVRWGYGLGRVWPWVFIKTPLSSDPAANRGSARRLVATRGADGGSNERVESGKAARGVAQHRTHAARSRTAQRWRGTGGVDGSRDDEPTRSSDMALARRCARPG
ncbi:hypothetical protein Scep_007079 [Stephania cephalantha]|uniref:Uncharacterized protein n=1 Tax=Stephania cephalantha TaxID=152367 RepID=A0AAP0KBR2_9MAGN